MAKCLHVKPNKTKTTKMSLVIGLDTGGTYTDAALFDVDQGVVRTTAKALTTREDLSIGLGVAIVKVLAAYDGKPDDIQLVSLSTTLATNAVVEGVGGRVGLFMIGFDDGVLERADLARALGRDPVLTSSQAAINLMVVFKYHWILPH